MRSEPLRSTRTEIPEYLLSKSLATFSATGKSTDVYQTTFPSFSAAATRLGVIAVVGTASARETRDAIEPIAKAADPFRKLLRGRLLCICSAHTILRSRRRLWRSRKYGSFSSRRARPVLRSFRSADNSG